MSGNAVQSFGTHSPVLPLQTVPPPAGHCGTLPGAGQFAFCEHASTHTPVPF